MGLLTRGASSPKLAKDGEGIESVILHMMPGRTCPYASAGCLTACLNTAGRGAMSSVQQARQRRTDWFFEDRPAFMDQLTRELHKLELRAFKKGFRPVARLNGTSDIPWERLKLIGTRLNIFELFPNITFYDYTKAPSRAHSMALPPNYSLTLSRTEAYEPGDVQRAVLAGANVAVVFDTPKGKPLPATYESVPVIDGRLNDWRFNDPSGVVVGLSALGKARKDTTGFVVRVED